MMIRIMHRETGGVGDLINEEIDEIMEDAGYELCGSSTMGDRVFEGDVEAFEANTALHEELTRHGGESLNWTLI